MAKTKLNAEREHRIEMEVVVDAYTEEECAMSWYCYLDEKLSFPFEANVRKQVAPVNEVERLLREVRDAWAEMLSRRDVTIGVGSQVA